ncbi:hypothetical protein CUJ84_Chr001621 [Rhizobium leguminosarum]|uniref:Uncharacterized protein n=1 Tax=Rhizobium leguminosarum TaxID=384 RepID=A0A2K9Z1A0_RHILE|nr:hypothetical protein CUJ84_Chr001621 [Rhizobium leguminosarum]
MYRLTKSTASVVRSPGSEAATSSEALGSDGMSAGVALSCGAAPGGGGALAGGEGRSQSTRSDTLPSIDARAAGEAVSLRI